MYDVTDYMSFSELPDWLQSLDDVGNIKPLVLVGNKVDTDNESREVDKSKVQQLADQHKSKHYEISATENIGINTLMAYLVE